jgi:uncharacterized protein
VRGRVVVRRSAAGWWCESGQVKAAVELLDGGATVPFIARYRKEATGGLDDIQLRELEHRLGYLRELEDRREAVLKSIDEQGKLTPALRAAIDAAPTKQELEDLYLPFKPKRRTKGQMARERASSRWPTGCLPTRRWTRPPRPSPSCAEKGEGGEDFTTVPAVLDGVRDILSERWAEDAALVQRLREWLWTEGLFKSTPGERQGREPPRCGQVPRLLRLRRAHRPRAVAPGAGGVPGPATGDPGRQAGTAGRARARPSRPSPRASIALHLGWRHAGRPATT